MPDISTLKDRIDRLAATLERMDREHLCAGALSAGVATQPRPALAELEAAKAEAEAIRRELAALKNRSRLDPEVRALENKLDEALSKSYWLYQKCKEQET